MRPEWETELELEMQMQGQGQRDIAGRRAWWGVIVGVDHPLRLEQVLRVDCIESALSLACYSRIIPGLS